MNADKPSLRLTPQQLAIVLVVEAQIASLQYGANQLGGFLKLREADALIAARDVLVSALGEMHRQWSGQVVLASAADVPRMVAP